MALKLFSDDVAVRAQVAPAALAAGTTSGTGIDRHAAANLNAAFDGGKAVISVGAVTGTPDAYTITVKVEDSANNSSWATAEDGEGNQYALDGLEASKIYTIDNINIGRLRRYVRISVVVTFTAGTSPKVQVCAVMLLGNAQQNPVS